MVSIIIPVYNAEKYVAETVQSVLASTYTDLEVVCMDDGSTDQSLNILNQLAQNEPRLRVLHQANAGVCNARNAAIAASKGEYILPVDADDIVLPHFIAEAVEVLNTRAEVKAVAPQAVFFGDREGMWQLPPFSLKKEAHKNILACCAMYRRCDYEQTNGGYCAEIIAREDWDFWINLLKNGGKVVRLPKVGLKYRYHKNSKRKQDRELKRHVINTLNQRHPEFFEQWLHGPLRYQRSWSRCINTLHHLFCPRCVHTEKAYTSLRNFIASLPTRFSFKNNGHLIYKGRNELRTFNTPLGSIVVKSFCTPNLINRIAYGIFRSSKAERSCQYAALLRSKGIGSPAPVGWCSVRRGILFTQSYYASLKSELPYTYIDLIKGNIAANEAADYLRAIGRTAGKLHNAGIIHRDFSRGNLLLGKNEQGEVEVEIVDLNRLRFHTISMKEGLKNFERLPATTAMRQYLAEGYAQERGYNLDECLQQWPETEAMNSAEAKAERH